MYDTFPQRVKYPTFINEEHTLLLAFLYSQDNVVLGGTRQKGEEKLDKDQRYYDDIMARCCRLVPSLKHAVVERTWVGLRPWRSSVRLEVEVISVNGRRLPVSRKVAISCIFGQWNADFCCLSDEIKIQPTLIFQTFCMYMHFTSVLLNISYLSIISQNYSHF